MKLTHAFYINESTEFVQKAKNTATDFLHHCDVRRTEEQKRVEDILPNFIKQEVLDTTDRALLSGRLDWLSKGRFLPHMFTLCANDLFTIDMQLWALLWSRRKRYSWAQCISCLRGWTV